ncbi:alpha/beta fold hydrolase [Aromatoleum sp.]|uniref:alpha/beta fold hydrolase n=1 Tax=Aromatoleum sp. TaxID=2307007 RepID=UPI002FC9C97B
MRIGQSLLLVLGCVSALRAVAQMPEGEYLDGEESKVAVVLAHGRGNSADGNVVGPLRRAIHKELGLHTLSLRMPDPGVDSPESPELASAFPEAYRRIQAALDYLKNEKKVERIYLLGHSMGGRMTSGFLANNPDAGVAGFIGVGMTAGGKEPVNTNLNLRKVKVPIIDIYGDNEMDAKAASFRKTLVSERFLQVVIPGAKHDYRGYEKPVADAVIGWLKQQDARQER